MGISNNYQSPAANEGNYKNVREYSDYLMNKYSCLKPGKNASVTVTSGMLRKAMNDESTGAWLERELSKAPDYIREAQQSASARGWRLTSVSIEFGEEYTTMYTCVVTDTPGTDSSIDKWLEQLKENKEEKKAAEEKLKEKKAEEVSHTFKGTDLKSVTESFIEKMVAMNSVTGFDVKV